MAEQCRVWGAAIGQLKVLKVVHDEFEACVAAIQQRARTRRTGSRTKTRIAEYTETGGASKTRCAEQDQPSIAKKAVQAVQVKLQALA